MIISEIRSWIALIDGPRCGAAWESDCRDEDGPLPGGVCDLHVGHAGYCGIDQDRCTPWVDACRVLLAALDAGAPAVASDGDES